LVKVDDIAKEIAKQISQYTSLVEEEIGLAKEELTKEGVSLLRANSPIKTGGYAKGWRLKKSGKNMIIYNATNYQLTHLLEHGHVKRDGGRTQAIPHIGPVEEKIVKEFEKRVERAIKS
jgi:hypothetical protein